MVEDDSGDRVSGDDIPLKADNPYADIDRSRLPQWWQEAIEEFRRHDIRTYRPPRFSDDALKYKVVEHLEAKHGVRIDFMGINVSPSDDWTVRIDGEPVGEIGCHRASEAYTVFEMESAAFENWITERLTES